MEMNPGKFTVGAFCLGENFGIAVFEFNPSNKIQILRDYQEIWGYELSSELLRLVNKYRTNFKFSTIFMNEGVPEKFTHSLRSKSLHPKIKQIEDAQIALCNLGVFVRSGDIDIPNQFNFESKWLDDLKKKKPSLFTGALLMAKCRSSVFALSPN